MKPHVRIQGVEYYLHRACPWYGLLCSLVLNVVPEIGEASFKPGMNPWSPWRTSILMFFAFYLVNLWLWHGLVLQPAKGKADWSREKLRSPLPIGCATGIFVTLVMCAMPLLTMPIPAPPEIYESVWRTMLTLAATTLIFQTLMSAWMAMLLYNADAAMPG